MNQFCGVIPLSPKAESPRPRAVEKAATALRLAILQGEHGPGSALPPERVLAETLGVSRLTLRAALSRLENEGLLRPVQGSGTLVLDFRRSGGLELLGPLLGVALSGGSVPLGLLVELLEIRLALAAETVALAARRATEADFAALSHQLAEQRLAIDDPVAFMRADLAFARLWVRAARNLPLELLFNNVERALLSQAEGFVLFVAPDPRATLAVYERLLSLLRQRDPDRISKLARRLLGMQDVRLLRALRPELEAERERDEVDS